MMKSGGGVFIQSNSFRVFKLKIHKEPGRVFLSKTVGGRDAGVERQGRQSVCVFLKGIPDWAFNVFSG
ncbi:MAG: hypothetical protein DHS20C10_10870 [marine bacterium B5-7]|nr:MAG: hypothetical protein DHS20C10_10870 [marine bacterium B5-7]